jgi:hypothetical protein
MQVIFPRAICDNVLANDSYEQRNGTLSPPMRIGQIPGE